MALLLACSSAETPETQEVQTEPEPRIAIPVEISEVKLQDVVETLELTGTVQPWDEFTVSSEITARVETIHAREGDWIRENGLLLEFDRVKREVERKSRQAQLQKAEVELQFARKRLERAEALLAKGAISQSETDTLREQVDLSESAVNVAQLAIESIQEELADTHVFSPVDGQVAERFVSRGETVSPTARLFSLIQMNPVKVVTEITEPYLAEIQKGERVEMTLDAFPEQQLSGRVYRIHPVANPDSGAFPVEIQVSNPARRLQVGMVARLDLRGRRFEQALTIPLEAVVNLQDQNYVYLVQGDRARQVPVQIRQRVENFAIVEADLEAGQQVVTRGNSAITDGTPVQVVSP